jgi:hypothetical protein
MKHSSVVVVVVMVVNMRPQLAPSPQVYNFPFFSFTFSSFLLLTIVPSYSCQSHLSFNIIKNNNTNFLPLLAKDTVASLLLASVIGLCVMTQRSHCRSSGIIR